MYRKWLRYLRTHRTTLIGIAVALCIGGGVGWFLHDLHSTTGYRPFREEDTQYSFISPLLFVSVPEEHAFPRYTALKHAVANYVQKAKAKSDVQNVSVYFRNMDTSQWIGVHPEERFAPASMMKVVTGMAIMRESETRPSLLSTRIELEHVEAAFPLEETIYPPAHPIESGKTYSVDTLLRRLLTESDNAANYALIRLIGEQKLFEVHEDLQLEQQLHTAQAGYTAQEYSRIFRALYNGSYLSRPSSERLLKLLSEANFSKGIVAGVPEGTVVSHKFGVRSMAQSDEALEEGTYAYHELHDCGIVYHPRYPYFLCVMTRGDDLASLETVIKDVSHTVWSEVERAE